MTVTESTINENHKESLKQNSGAEFAKVDLHVHTPASGDAQARHKHDFKYNIGNIPRNLEQARQMAEVFVIQLCL